MNHRTRKQTINISFVKTTCYSLFIYFLPLLYIGFTPTGLIAQSVQSASIENGSSNRLTVTFSENITISNAEGFRLVGGVARIDQLLSGSGSNTLTFTLTDYALPDDIFELLHWPEMSDARSATGKLGSVEKQVANKTTRYNGSGTLYYVSTSGNDSNNGESKKEPFRTISKGLEKVKPGDFLLLKRGDVWDQTHVKITKSGNSSAYITLAAYGTLLKENGKDVNKPIIFSRGGFSAKYKDRSVKGATLSIQGANYIHVDNIHVKTQEKLSPSGNDPSVDDGIQLLHCEYPVISNCIAEAVGPYGFFGIRVNTTVTDNGFEAALYNNTYPVVVNCEIFNYQANLGTQIAGYDGRHEIKNGGLIENCISRDPVLPAKRYKNFVELSSYRNVWENIMVNRGEFNGFVIRKNNVFGQKASGIETYGAHDIIIEYNEVHDPADYDRGGLGIKAGGYNDAAYNKRYVNYNGEWFAKNVIVRYNKIYNITQGDTKDVNGIDTQSARSGKIYGNVLYNIRDHGIKINGDLNAKGWQVYNNTVLNCGLDAIHVYTDLNQFAGNIRIYNNILDAKGRMIQIRNGVTGIRGNNNIFSKDQNAVSTSYLSQDDKVISKISQLFENASENRYQLNQSSFAIDKGAIVQDSNYTKDISGNPIQGNPDIGCYEFGPIDPEPPNNEENGVAYAYYKDADKDWTVLPDFTSLSPEREGILPNFQLSSAEQEDYYGFRFTTFIEIATDGNYTFYTNSDDGSKLYINDQLVVDNDGLRPPVEKSGTLTLKAGRHQLVLDYFEGYGNQSLSVSYKGPNLSKQIIPNDVLFLEDNGNSTPGTSATIAIEAECLSFNATQWQKVTDKAASGGSYLKVRKSFNSNSENIIPSHTLKAEVSLPGAGTYHLFGRYKAKDFTNDSFWVRIDGGAWINWTLSNRNNVFAWKKVNNTEVTNSGFPLAAGSHTITVAYRESEAMLDKLQLSTDNTIPEGKGIQSPSGCQDTNNLITYSEIPTETSNTSFQLYPNPVDHTLSLHFGNALQNIKMVELTDLKGKKVYQAIINEGQKKVNLPTRQLPEGMYLLRWQQGNQLYMEKVVISHQ